MEIGINAMSSIGTMQKDFEGAILRLKDGGCTWIEAMSDWGARPETVVYYENLTGGPSGWDPQNTVNRIEFMKKENMQIRGIFVFDEILEEQAEDLGKYCRENGISYIVISFMEYGDIDDIYSKVSLIRKVSAILRAYGVRVLMHNHDHDTRIVEDRDHVRKQTMTIFLENCSPEELMLEVDTGWLVYAGIDPVEYVREHLDRIAVLHFKDICEGYGSMSRDDIFVPCGKGVVDFENILKAAAGKKDLLYVLDQDASGGDIIEDHIQSIKYFNKLETKIK